MMRSSLLLGLGLGLILTATAPADEPGALGRWRGTYLCNQGWTGVDLEIGPDEARAEAMESDQPGRYLKATFSFFQIATNPGVPSGRFTMRGSYDPATGQLKLGQERWLERPEHYVMVDLTGTRDPETDTIKGRVDGYNCGTFELRRADGPPVDAGSWLLGPDQAEGSETVDW